MLGSKRFYNIAATVKVKTTSSSSYLYTSTNARALRIQPYVQVYRARTHARTRSADSTVPAVCCFDSVVLRIRAARAPPLGLADTGGAGAVRHRRLHLLLPYYLVTERPPRPRRHGRAVVPPPPRYCLPRSWRFVSLRPIPCRPVSSVGLITLFLGAFILCQKLERPRTLPAWLGAGNRRGFDLPWAPRA